ncbi:hypothetical protein JZ751_011251 [Albula glossodonta]|uniref:Uncharacterized protein n=1 Tax=Albula glossodonta TaxID=121402 RepID=A0A8T2NWM8_9TELE|nr:hypothetical protein JZ751_011251 [Albula glossodonta]
MVPFYQSGIWAAWPGWRFGGGRTRAQGPWWTPGAGQGSKEIPLHLGSRNNFMQRTGKELYDDNIHYPLLLTLTLGPGATSFL